MSKPHKNLKTIPRRLTRKLLIEKLLALGGAELDNVPIFIKITERKKSCDCAPHECYCSDTIKLLKPTTIEHHPDMSPWLNSYPLNQTHKNDPGIVIDSDDWDIWNA